MFNSCSDCQLPTLLMSVGRTAVLVLLWNRPQCQYFPFPFILSFTVLISSAAHFHCRVSLAFSQNRCTGASSTGITPRPWHSKYSQLYIPPWFIQCFQYGCHHGPVFARPSLQQQTARLRSCLQAGCIQLVKWQFLGRKMPANCCPEARIAFANNLLSG